MRKQLGDKTTCKHSLLLILVDIDFLFHVGYRNNLRVLYCQNKGNTTRTSRYIPREPEKILDAPGLLNDFCEFL